MKKIIVFLLLLFSITIFQFVRAGTPKKWFPGHYIFHTPDDYTTSNSDLTFLSSEDGALFQGLMMYITWGQIETTKDSYRWDKIDGVLQSLPAGKKLAVSLSWQGWSKLQACPGDMIDNAEFDSGQHVKKGLYPFATIYLTKTMDRYLDFVRKFADRYDANPKIAFVTTAEIPFDPDARGPLYNAATAAANIFRLPSEMIPMFKFTPCGILGAWWSFGNNANSEAKLVSDTYNAGGGFGFPDVICLTCKNYNSNFRNEILENAGKWSCWMGVEWSDYLPDRAGSSFPQDIIESATKNKTNFIWWLRTNRTADGGYDFTTQALPYLKANPLAGICTNCPENIDCTAVPNHVSNPKESVKITPNPLKKILQINGDIQNSNISIVHVNGTIYYSQNQADRELLVNVTELPSGMYFIKIENSKNLFVHKLLKI